MLVQGRVQHCGGIGLSIVRAAGAGWLRRTVLLIFVDGAVAAGDDGGCVGVVGPEFGHVVYLFSGHAGLMGYCLAEHASL